MSFQYNWPEILGGDTVSVTSTTPSWYSMGQFTGGQTSTTTGVIVPILPSGEYDFKSRSTIPLGTKIALLTVYDTS